MRRRILAISVSLRQSTKQRLGRDAVDVARLVGVLWDPSVSSTTALNALEDDTGYYNEENGAESGAESNENSDACRVATTCTMLEPADLQKK